MIKSTDLRKGNYFKHEGKIAEVVTILSDEKSDFRYFGEKNTFLRKYSDADCPTPIELSKQILERFGFTRNRDLWFLVVEEEECTICVAEDFSISIFDTQENWDNGNYINPPALKEYVHELQNLYYDLKHESLVFVERK